MTKRRIFLTEEQSDVFAKGFLEWVSKNGFKQKKTIGNNFGLWSNDMPWEDEYYLTTSDLLEEYKKDI